MILNKNKILERIEEGLIEGYVDLKKQLQPCGFDLSIAKIQRYKTAGAVDFDNTERKMAEVEDLEFSDGWVNLKPGAYKVIYNETVKVPLDLMAIARTRSSLLRNGASVGTAVWDPGYHGRSESMLVVHNPIRIKKNARVVQLIFFGIDKIKEGYSGKYLLENIGGR